MIGSVLGFSFGVIGTVIVAQSITYNDDDYCWFNYTIGGINYLYNDRKCIRVFALMTHETFLCFGKFSFERSS